MASFIMAMNIFACAKKLHADLTYQIDLSLNLFTLGGAFNEKVPAATGG